MKSKVEDALNRQLNFEFHSFYTYLGMAAHCEAANLKGMAHWLRLQSEEELGHAHKIFDYLLNRGAKVSLKAIEAPAPKWTSLAKVFEAAYAQEQKVTESIDAIVTLALKENDHATVSFLKWFVDEQVEELDLVNEVIEKVKLVGSDGGALFILDRDMGQRRADADAEPEK